MQFTIREPLMKMEKNLTQILLEMDLSFSWAKVTDLSAVIGLIESRNGY